MSAGGFKIASCTAFCSRITALSTLSKTERLRNRKQTYKKINVAGTWESLICYTANNLLNKIDFSPSLLFPSHNKGRKKIGREKEWERNRFYKTFSACSFNGEGFSFGFVLWKGVDILADWDGLILLVVVFAVLAIQRLIYGSNPSPPPKKKKNK